MEFLSLLSNGGISYIAISLFVSIFLFALWGWLWNYFLIKKLDDIRKVLEDLKNKKM